MMQGGGCLRESYRGGGTLLVVLVCVLLTVAAAVGAKPNDLTLNRLTFDKSLCQPGEPCPCPADEEFCPDQLQFRRLLREFGYAISPMKVLPAETHGFAGGFFGMLGHLTFISNDEPYWENGARERGPGKALFLYQVTAQFTFIPYILEWGFTLGYLFTTSNSTIGVNVKLSPFEGFRKRVLGAFPDISFGFGLNRLIGDDEVSLTTGMADVAISYDFAPGGVVVLTPFIGFATVGVVAESELVDRTPHINAYEAGHCPIHQGQQPVVGTIRCVGGLSPDYNEVYKFDSEWQYFARLHYGVRLIYEVLSISVQAAHGWQFDRQADDPATSRINEEDPQNVLTTISFAVGLDF